MSRLEQLLRSPTCLTILVGLGLVLRAWAYVPATSLWLDEVLLARNIEALSLGELLTTPLLLDQVAPRGFLLLEKLSVIAFGKNELALRLPPFLCAVAAMLLFRRLAERTLEGLAVPFAVALFAIGIPFIKYGAEVKQYEGDATATILVLLLALDLARNDLPTRRLVFAGVAGFVLVWFSQASVLVLGGIGAAMTIEWLRARDRRLQRVVFITVPVWAAGCLLAVAAGRQAMAPSTAQFMQEFWVRGFMPLPFHPLAALRWLGEQSVSVFTDPTLLSYRWPVAYLAVAIAGFVALWRRRAFEASMLTAIVIVAVVAAVAQQYPFRGRLMFYLIPVLLLTIAAGAEWIRHIGARMHPAVGYVAMTALLAPPVAAIVATPPPYDIEHQRAVMAFLQQRRQPGDRIHAFPLARIPLLYYAERYGVHPGDFTTVRCDRDSTRAYVRDVDQFRGVRRLWLLSAENGAFAAARKTARSYLSTIGVQRDSLILSSLTRPAVGVELYDLSDSVRLAAADAESFPVPAMSTTQRPGCRPFARESPLDAFIAGGPPPQR
ncbi:MAG: hypothetical protein H7066_22870 [Cytophagaceae bacterium]|nr:hypothetical protein [Gemmatimonadaceae bacterium]